MPVLVPSRWEVFAGYEGEVRADEGTLPPAGVMGDAKFLAEQLAGQYVRRGAPVMVLRSGLVYGDRAAPRFLKQFLARARAGAEIVTHRMEGGPPRLDLLSVADWTAAAWGLMASVRTGTFHCGGGALLGTDDIARLIVASLDSRSPLRTIDMEGSARERSAGVRPAEVGDGLEPGARPLCGSDRLGAQRGGHACRSRGEEPMSVEEHDPSEKARQESFTWSRTTFHSEYNRFLAEFKVESCLEHARGDSLLDIACGDGLMTQMFAQRFATVVGVDANGNHLAEARKRLPGVEFHESLIEDVALPRRFDTVTMLDLLEHVGDPVGVLRKAAGFLEDDGVLIVHVPNARAINRRLAVLMGTLETCEELSPFDLQVAGHRRSYSLPTLCADVERAGLKVTRTGGIFYKILSTPQMDWFLKTGCGRKAGSAGGGWAARARTEGRVLPRFLRARKQHPEDCNIIFACVTR